MERLQPRDVQSWLWGIEGALSVSRGNSYYVDGLGGFVVGHRWSRDWIRLFTGLIGVAYVQPDLADFGDLRTLVAASLRISLTEDVDLTVQNEWRHDSRPPDGVEEDDFVLSTVFAVSFRQDGGGGFERATG